MVEAFDASTIMPLFGLFKSCLFNNIIVY